MVTARSEKYPDLFVGDVNVQFQGGVAEVDQKQATRLRQLAHFGVVVDDETSEPVRELEPPRKNASREAWAAFAVDSGVDVPEDASRGDIQELLGLS